MPTNELGQEVNSQGLTAQQMGEYAGYTAADQTVSAPVSEPTSTVTSPNISNAVSNVSGSGTLTSEPADSYVQKMADEAKQKELDLRAKVKESENWQNRVNTAEDVAAIEAANKAGLSLNTSVGVPTTLKENVKKVTEQTDPARAAMEEEQVQARATQRTSAYQMGQSGTAYGDAATAKLETQIKRQGDEFARKERDLMQEAWSAAYNGKILESEKLRGEAERSFQERLQIEKLAMDERDQIMKIQEFEDTTALKAEERASRTLKNLIDNGIEISDIPQSYMDQLDADLNLPQGSAAAMWEIGQEERQAQNLEDEEARKTKRLENAGKLVGLLEKTVAGGSFEVDGTSYYVTGKTPDVVTGTEIDDNGNGTFWSYDKNTKQITSTPMGQVGTTKDGWEVATLEDGSKWRVNPKTGQSQPFYATEAQTTWNGTFPEGTRGPILPGGDPANAGQCAAATNYWYGERVFSDRFEDKMREAAPYEVSIEGVEVGDTLVMTAGNTGHVAIVNGVEKGPDGNYQLMLTESNMVPPGQGLVSHSRSISIADPKIKKVARIPTPNLPLAGPDSTVTSAIETGTKPGILGAGTTGGKKLSVSEAQALGVPYGTTEEQAASMGIKPKTQGRALESGQANKLAEGRNLTSGALLGDLGKLIDDNKSLFGPVRGAFGGAYPYGESVKVQDDLKRATQTIGSYLEGGVLRAEDEVKYRKMLPQLTDTPEVARDKLEGIQKLLEAKNQSYIQSYEDAGFDVSNFKSGTTTEQVGSQYKIGDKRMKNGEEYTYDGTNWTT